MSLSCGQGNRIPGLGQKKRKKRLKGLSINQHFIDFKLMGGLLSVPGVQYVPVCLYRHACMYELAVYGFCLCVKMNVLIAQLCLTLCNPMVCSSPGSSVHGILQARILERFPFPSPRDLHNQRSSPDLLHCRQMPREAPNKKAGCAVFCIIEGSILP